MNQKTSLWFLCYKPVQWTTVVQPSERVNNRVTKPRNPLTTITLPSTHMTFRAQKCLWTYICNLHHLQEWRSNRCQNYYWPTRKRWKLTGKGTEISKDWKRNWKPRWTTIRRKWYPQLCHPIWVGGDYRTSNERLPVKCRPKDAEPPQGTDRDN
jgi:hypothetical protein